MNMIEMSPEEWTNEEFLAWARGEAVAAEPMTDEDVALAASEHYEFEVSSDINAVKATVIAQFETETSVEEEPVVEPEPTPEPVMPPEPEPSAEPEETVEEAVVQEETRTPREIMVQDGLDAYINGMKPGRSHQPNEGVTLQTQFYRLIQNIMRMDGQDFVKFWGELLAAVNENIDGVFSERYVYRYVNMMTIPPNDRKNFERIINLLITTANPATRKAAYKQVDLEATLVGFGSAEIHQRVAAFYEGI